MIPSSADVGKGQQIRGKSVDPAVTQSISGKYYSNWRSSKKRPDRFQKRGLKSGGAPWMNGEKR